MSLNGTEFSDVQILGMDDDMAGAVVKTAIKRKPVKSPGSGAATGSRKEFLERFAFLPRNIQADLNDGRKHMTDGCIQVSKLFASGSGTLKIITDGDAKTAGLSTLNNGKLEPNEYFLCTGLSLFHGLGATANIAEYTPFLPYQIVNGDFEFKGNGKTLQRITACDVFRSTQTIPVVTTGALPIALIGVTATKEKYFNYFKLDNPKILLPQQLIEVNVTVTAALAATSCLRVCLWGSFIITY